ncbi:MAG: DUF721 domain-containing protein [Candidatus Melainabacteria bacterium]|nr:DUF721 domain-containing protein [Candidatus Melainabacteria bacterium]
MSEKLHRKSNRFKSNLIKIGDLISIVKESFGLEKSLNIMALKEIWPLVTNFEIAKYSQPDYFDKENNLVIAVKSGALATDLSMQKVNIVSKLKEATKNTNIIFKDVRFINRS